MKKILVTRPAHQAIHLGEMLQGAQMSPVYFPVVTIDEPKEYGPVDKAIANIHNYDWLILTSANGVDAFIQRVKKFDSSALDTWAGKIAVIGPATAQRLEQVWKKPDCMPSSYVAEQIFPLLGDVVGRKILLARADIARRSLFDMLVEADADVHEISLYSIVQNSEIKDLPQKPDAITLTSSAIARHTKALLERSGRGEWFNSIPLFCIGPITANTVRELGVEPAVVAQQYTCEGLVQSLSQFFS